MYNNEDLGIYRIKHYPFKKYKVGSAPLTRKRNNSLEEVRAIRDCVTKAGSRAELAKEIYMLSFYLCGMNAVDFYHLTRKDIRNGRIDYNRAKTRYSTYGVLDTALSQGMKQLRKLTGITGATIYWARHTFATVARNACRISKDDVALALNHVDDEHRTTDIYIEKDWSIVDEVQIKVITLLRRLDIKIAAKQKKEALLKDAA